MSCFASRHKLILILFCVWLQAPLSPAGSQESDLVSVGERHLLSGELGEAREVLERALLDHPGNPRILSDLGRVYFHLGELEKAEERSSEALLIESSEPWITCWSCVYLGKIYSLKNEFTRARYYLARALGEGDPTNCVREARKLLAYLRVMMHAQKNLDKSIRTECCFTHYQGGTIAEEELEFLAQLFQGYFEKILNLLPLERSRLPKIHIYLHPPGSKYDLWDGKEVFARYRHNEFHVFYDGMNQMGHVEHEMVHFLTADLQGNAFAARPIFAEGLAEYVVGAPWEIPLDNWVKGFLEEGSYVALDQLMNPSRFREINPVVAYEEAGSFVKFLIETYGMDGFLHLVGERRSLEETCGKPVHDLEREWLRRVNEAPLAPDEMELIRYRVRLGSYFHRSRSERGSLPWVGVTCRINGRNAVISDIVSLSPAEKAGLRRGDVIKKIEETEIRGTDAWKAAGIVQKKRAGEVVRITVDRGGSTNEFKVIVGEEPY